MLHTEQNIEIDTKRLSFFDNEDKVYRQGNGRKVLLSHAYVLDAEVNDGFLLSGKLLRGVTSVLDGTSSKPQLIQWAADMATQYVADNGIFIESENAYKISGDTLKEARTAHTKKKEKAATKGTDMHAEVEKFILATIRGESYEFPIEIYPFVEWSRKENVTFIAAEQILYSEKHSVAGTADFICVLNDKLTIGDLKTMPKLWSPDPFVQTGAYSLMLTELTGAIPEQSIIVRMCDPEDERVKKYNSKPFDTYLRSALQEDEDMFLTRLKCYEYNNNFTPA
jgi:hypothetical protein